jgi:hypothetical protein
MFASDEGGGESGERPVRVQYSTALWRAARFADCRSSRLRSRVEFTDVRERRRRRIRRAACQSAIQQS